MSASSLGLRTSNGTITQACLELRTVAAIAPILIEQSFIVQGAGTALSIGLGTPAARGVTPVNTLFQRDYPATSVAPPSTTNGALAWATSPTAPTTFSRRWSCGAVTGVGIVWVFPRGLVIPPSSSIVVWNITATVAADTNSIVDE
jgi:hypothetical protein